MICGTELFAHTDITIYNKNFVTYTPIICLHSCLILGQRFGSYFWTNRSVNRARSVARGDNRTEEDERQRALDRMRASTRNASRNQTQTSHTDSHTSHHTSRDRSRDRSRTSDSRKTQHRHVYGPTHHVRHRSRSPNVPTATPVYPNFDDSFGRVVTLPDLNNLGPLRIISGLPLDASANTPPSGTSIPITPDAPNTTFKANPRNIRIERVTLTPPTTHRAIRPTQPFDQTCSVLSQDVVSLAYRDSLIHKQHGWVCPTRDQVLMAIRKIPDTLGPLRMVT